MVKKQILLVDNDTDFLATRAEYLEKAGYQILQANSLEQAKRLLNDAHIHLVVLDIRMTDDTDEKDISGLSLAKDTAYQSLPKIMMTGFPTYEAVRDALGPALDGLSPAVDFITKRDGPKAMIVAIETAFSTFVKVNWGLSIQWDPHEPLTFLHLANLLGTDLPGDVLLSRAGELEDLVRQLFYTNTQIRFGRLLWYDLGRFCLSVLMQSQDNATDLRIMVCGIQKLLKLERANLGKMAPEILQGTELRDWVETMRFSANLYGLSGPVTETIQTLRDLFFIGKERPLKAVFDHLLEDILRSWHQHGQVVRETHDLMSLYRQQIGLTAEDLPRLDVEQRVDALLQSSRTLDATEIKRDKGRISFHFPQETPKHFPDPVETVYTSLAQDYASEPVVCRISPGRITADNVLVDAKQRVWLTDFAYAGQAPQWWDFICLEAIIRFDLAQAPDLIAWQEFEACLMNSTRLDEKLEQSDVIPELRTSLALIEQVRRQAAIETGPNLLPYYAGLLAWTVKAMTRYDPGVLSTHIDKLRSAHLLLAASMIAEQLETGINKTPILGGQLNLDDGIVWIGDRRVTTLTGLRLKLLECLYEKANQIVNNRNIVENAYGEKYDSTDRNQSQRIRQEIRRLREEIEPNLNRPRYILTERGRGYRLNLSGEEE